MPMASRMVNHPMQDPLVGGNCRIVPFDNELISTSLYRIHAKPLNNLATGPYSASAAVDHDVQMRHQEGVGQSPLSSLVLLGQVEARLSSGSRHPPAMTSVSAYDLAEDIALELLSTCAATDLLPPLTAEGAAVGGQ
jgi:hypothetical protein